MKRLSDYKGKEAMELWADLLEPAIKVFGDKEIATALRRKAMLPSAKMMVERYPDEVISMMLRIDDTPIDGLNIILRLVTILAEVGSNPTVKSFFPSLAEEEKEETPFGSAMESTEETPNISSDM